VVLRIDSKVNSKRVFTLLAVVALSTSACSSTDSATAPNPTTSIAGPPVWTDAEKQYLDAIAGADLAASIFLSATNYIQIGATVCDGLKQDMPLEEIFSALATSGKENGLNEKQRNDFTLITSAAAVTFLCKDQIDKYELSQ
jgi:hypothetical protein